MNTNFKVVPEPISFCTSLRAAPLYLKLRSYKLLDVDDGLPIVILVTA